MIACAKALRLLRKVVEVSPFVHFRNMPLRPFVPERLLQCPCTWPSSQAEIVAIVLSCANATLPNSSFARGLLMHDDDSTSNPSLSPRFDEIFEMRREFLKGAAASTALLLTGSPLAGCSSNPATAGAKPASPTFKSIAVSTADRVVVPEGYEA